jgi:hypothetical protein
VVGGHVGSHDFEDARLNVLVGDALDMPIPHLFVPNLQRFAAYTVEDRQESRLECVFEHCSALLLTFCPPTSVVFSSTLTGRRRFPVLRGTPRTRDRRRDPVARAHTPAHSNTRYCRVCTLAHRFLANKTVRLPCLVLSVRLRESTLVSSFFNLERRRNTAND